MKWTDEEIEIIKQDYPFSPTVIIACKLKRRTSQVYNMAYKLRLKKDIHYLESDFSGRMLHGDTKGLKTRFNKGHIPWNKGLKGLYIGGEKTQFKSGNIPHNHRPVGSIRIQSDGYKYIKVSEPKTWVALQKYNWERVNGPIPEGMFLKFKDKNPLNCELDNLYLSDRKSNMIANTIHRYPAELKFAIRTLNKLKNEIYGKE